MDRALFRELNECVCSLNFLGEVSRLLGIWTSTPLFPRDGPSRIDAFCTLNLPKGPEALAVCEGALSKLLTGKVYDYLGFSSVSSAATGALAPLRKSHVSLHMSAVNAPNLAHICGDVALSYLNVFEQRMLLSRS